MIKVEYPEIQGSGIVNVHSAAIHIENRVTLKQRQAWLYLLYRAFPTLKESTKIELPLNDVKQFLGERNKDNAPLKKLLKELVGIVFEWNIFDKDIEEWGATALLSMVKIVTRHGKSMLTVEFSSEISQKLAEPTMYAKINLLISQRFKSKHTLALYCLALDYLWIKDNYGCKDFELEELKKFLGVSEKKYSTKEFKRTVLIPAQEEINNSSDIFLKITDITIGRKITGFRLEMWVKSDFLPVYASPEGITLLKAAPEAEITMFSDFLNGFHEKYGVDIHAKHFKATLNALKTVFPDNLVAFLDEVAKSAAAKEEFLKSVAAFYVSELNDAGRIAAFKDKEEKKAQNQQLEREQLATLVDKQLEVYYGKQDRASFKEYLVGRLPELEAILRGFLEADVSDWGINELRSRFKNELNADSITKGSAISTTLYKYKDNLSYISLDFEKWKSDFLADPAKADTVRDVKQQAREDLRKLQGQSRQAAAKL